jgi:hypothetical protein
MKKLTENDLIHNLGISEAVKPLSMKKINEDDLIHSSIE